MNTDHIIHGYRSPATEPEPEQPGPLYLHCAELSRQAEVLANELRNLLHNLKRLGL